MSDAKIADTPDRIRGSRFYDGIRYPSAMAPKESNVVLFDPSAVEIGPACAFRREPPRDSSFAYEQLLSYALMIDEFLLFQPDGILFMRARFFLTPGSSSQACEGVRARMRRKPLRCATGQVICKPFPSPTDWRSHWLYEIMVDRFNNPQLPPPGDWNRKRPDDQGRFGGTFEGIRQKLDYTTISKIATVRRQHPALQFGRQYFREVPGDGAGFGFSNDKSGILALSRLLNDREVVVIANTNLGQAFPGQVLVDDRINAGVTSFSVAFSNKGTTGRGAVARGFVNFYNDDGSFRGNGWACRVPVVLAPPKSRSSSRTSDARRSAVTREMASPRKALVTSFIVLG